MAQSRWYKTPSLHYIPRPAELERKQEEYKRWLGWQRRWNRNQVELYLAQQREWLAANDNTHL